MGRRLFVGVDPGTKGAICIMDESGKVLDIIPMPTYQVEKTQKRQTKVNPTGKGKGYKTHEDIAGILDFFYRRVDSDDDVTASIEELLPVPKFGLANSCSMVGGMKLLVGICAGLGFRINLLKAKAWQKIVFPEKCGPADKQRSLMFAREIYPEWAPLMKTKDSDGVAESCLIAEAGRRIFLGKATQII